MLAATFTFSAVAQQPAKKEDKAKKEVKQTQGKAKGKETTPPPAPKLKKNGTSDKRFKENKKPEGPLKKDGTADMRFKDKAAKKK